MALRGPAATPTTPGRPGSGQSTATDTDNVLMARAPVEEWLDLVEDGVVMVADTGLVEFVNAAAARLLEVNGEAARGKPLMAVVRDHRLEAACLAGEAVEITTRQRILAARGVPGGLILRDITEARRARDEARELLAVLSHELRTPATTIRSTLEALSGGDLPAPQRERFLAMANAETARLVRLLNDLTVDVKPPVLRSVPLRDAAERALALLAETMAERDIVAQADGIGAYTVLADNDKLLQSLVNLLENAALHGPSSARVELVARPSPGNPDLVEVAVRDQGEPLPAGRMAELFSPDARTRAVKARGTGLGLFIVRSIAERWGGYSWGRPLEDGNEFGFSVRLVAEGG